VRVIHSKHPLPRSWAGIPGIDKVLLEHNIGIGKSKLRLKLLVFETRISLQRFCSACGFIGGNARGANAITCSLRSLSPVAGSKRRTLTVDPTFYAVVVFVRKCISLDIIAHESVHAAIALAERTRYRNNWDPTSNFLEEAICYPAGILTKAISATLVKNGVLTK
jgi:hypothetical protein